MRNESHLHGTFSLKIRPWASAEFGAGVLNGDKDLSPSSALANYCLPRSSVMPNAGGLSEALKKPVDANAPVPTTKIPIRLRGLGPWTVSITLNGRSYRELQVQPTNEGAEEGFSTDKNSRPTLMDLVVDQAGIYAITRIIDGSGQEGRVEGDPSVQIDHCPQLRLDGMLLQKSTGHDGGIEVCRDQKFPLRVWLQGGEAPYFLTFDIISEGGSHQLHVPRVTPLETKSGSWFAYVHDLDLANAHAWLPSPSVSSQFLLRVSSVQDSRGRIHRYGDWDKGDATVIELVPPPQIRWSGSGETIKLLDNAKRLDLPVSIRGAAPFEFKIQLPDGKIVKKTGTSEQLQVDVPPQAGIFKLISVKDALCVGNVDIRDELIVQAARAPTVHIHGEPIRGPCQGDMGLKFVFDVTGEGPWIIYARQHYTPPLAAGEAKSKRKSEERQLTIPLGSPHFEHSWRPEHAGLYKLDFVSLSDQNYDRTPLHRTSYTTLTYEQDIKPAPGAAFTLHQDRQIFRCAGQSLEVPVRFSGIGPWVLRYSLMDSERRSQFGELLAIEEKMDLRVEDLYPQGTSGGRYTLSLVSVVDGTGCQAPVDSQSVPITIYEHAPSIGFSNESVIVREGFANDDLAPISAHANSPPLKVHLKFEPPAPEEKAQYYSITLDSTVRGVPLAAAGRWTLVDVWDQHCQGTINPDHATTVVKIRAKPSASFTEGHPGWTSRAHESFNSPVIALKGTGRITLTVSLQYALDETLLPTSIIEKRILTGSDGEKLAFWARTAAPPPGYYRLELLTISDDAFLEMSLKDTSMTVVASFVLHVLPDPAPRIVSATRVTAFCYEGDVSTDHPGIGPFILDFTGAELPGMFPVRLKYELVEGTQVTDADEVEVGERRLFNVGRPSVPPSSGVLHLKALRVENHLGGVWDISTRRGIGKSNGASLAMLVKDQIALPITLVERPSFRLPSATLCVGDVAHFELRGNGPWTLKYRLNGKSKTDTVSSNRLNVLLAEAGSLQIESLCNKHCCADIGKGEGAQLPVEYTVHPLPSAYLSEGTRYVREGEEAEFVVAFKGTPPFAYSYQRIDDVDGRIIDTVSYEGIEEYEHRVKVSSQGTFKVTHVQDHYCQYPKRATAGNDGKK